MASSPVSICLLRLSALGDVTHVLPLIHTLQHALPQTRLEWIIDPVGYKLVEGLPGVEFHVFAKKSGWGGMRALGRQLSLCCHKRTLLHMQLSLRANLLSHYIPAQRRIGYPWRQSKEFHSLFVNEHIPNRSGRHVLDTFGSFSEPFGIQQHQIRWNLPIPLSAHQWAEAQWPNDGQPVLIISPCSSHPLRNWPAERYAAVAAHAVQRGWRIVLCGGATPHEQTSRAIILAQAGVPILDLMGRDTLKRFAALAQRAQLVMTPDSGPMHIANAVGTAVLGLHAASNPLRSGPYSNIRYCVNRYDDAAQRFLGCHATQLRWGTKIERNGVMELIRVDDAIAAFERYCSDMPPSSQPNGGSSCT